MISPDAFIHPKALVDEGVAVGAGTPVWAFAHLVLRFVFGLVRSWGLFALHFHGVSNILETKRQHLLIR